MDLISKKAAVSRISDLLILELKGQRIPTWNEVYNAIGDIHAVPAVPLDELARWIVENLDPRCDCDYCLHEDTDFVDRECCNCPRMSEEQVKEALEKWMEEQKCTSTDTEH